MTFTNAAFYKFAPIADPQKCRALLQERTSGFSTKGTIILGHEGVNCYFAGIEEEVQLIVRLLEVDCGLGTLEVKRSYSDKQPFRRFLIKVKKEIVTMGQPNIDPAHHTGDYVEAKQLKEWLDTGEPLILVDTRNDYEVRMGTFKGAINPNIKEFRSFPNWVAENLADKKDAKIVTFCTGGIRCEKATAFMRQVGFNNVFQVKGGILKYLEETKDRAAENHWEGDCFVFDHRVAVNKELKKTTHELCYACWAPLSEQDCLSDRYIVGEQCPHCYVEKRIQKNARWQRGQQKHQAQLQARRERAKVTREKYNSLKSS